jgi:hypothetical protein
MYTYVQKKELIWNVTRTVIRKESTHHEVVNIVMLLATANRFLAGGGWPEFTGWLPSPHSGFFHNVFPALSLRLLDQYAPKSGLIPFLTEQ